MHCVVYIIKYIILVSYINVFLTAISVEDYTSPDDEILQSSKRQLTINGVWYTVSK